MTALKVDAWLPIGPSTVSDPPNRRDSGRFEAHFKCHCSDGRQEGVGTLEDISRSGALIEKTVVVPERGDRVDLSLEVPVIGSLVLRGRVVRRTITGFAIEFERLEASASRLVDDLAAIVEARKRQWDG